jgi:hypothetical protein
MDTDELLLAAKVREIAQDYRNEQRIPHYAAMKVIHKGADLKAEMARWDNENPSTPYIRMALTELELVAKIIRKYRTVEPQ